MGDELNIVSRRRLEVLANMATARKAIETAKGVITAGEAELLDLDVAGRVLAGLTGVAWPPESEADAKPEASNVVAPVRLHARPVSPPGDRPPPTMTMLITDIMELRASMGLLTAAPREMAQDITQHFHTEAKGEYVSSIAWRMWKRGQLHRVSEGVYSLPKTNEASDQLPLGDGSEASDSDQQQDREADPGGGT